MSVARNVICSRRLFRQIRRAATDSGWRGRATKKARTLFCSKRQSVAIAKKSSNVPMLYVTTPTDSEAAVDRTRPSANAENIVMRARKLRTCYVPLNDDALGNVAEIWRK